MTLGWLVLLALLAVTAGACRAEEAPEASGCTNSLVVTDQFGESVELIEGAGAFGMKERRGYKVWTGDYAVPTEAAADDGLAHPPAGNHVLFLYVVTDGPATKAGTEFVAGAGFPTLTLYAEAAGGTFGFRATGEAGTARVIDVNDDRICLEVDYKSSELTVSGIVDAPLVD